MTRAEAIALIVENELGALNDAQRQSMLLDWWSIDDEAEEFWELPELLRAEIKRRDEPDGTRNPLYDALLRIDLRYQFVGVRNEYLAHRLAPIGYKREIIEGDVEVLEICRCCEFRTLAERGGYDICPICFWEDDGSHDPDTVSGPNHMTLREGRENFARLGACDESSVEHVLSDGTMRYER